MGKQPATIGRNRSLRYTSKLSNLGCSSVCRVNDNSLTSVENSSWSAGNSGQLMLFKVGERGWVVLLADRVGIPPSLEGPGISPLTDMTVWESCRSGAGSVPGTAGGETYIFQKPNLNCLYT